MYEALGTDLGWAKPVMLGKRPGDAVDNDRLLATQYTTNNQSEMSGILNLKYRTSK
tara:strand:+ start:608 stop:775 length:168 start_codon:yes stop_codon:yes gene_type:complete